MSNATPDWQSRVDDDGILWLILDKQDTETNVLSIAVLEQLESLIDGVVEKSPKAVVFRSGKAKGFIAGADVNEFLGVRSTQESLIIIKRGPALPDHRPDRGILHGRGHRARARLRLSSRARR